jgi:SAM-dependent methyltransferase
MEQSMYQILEEQEDHWWFLGRKKIILQLIQKYSLKNQPLAIADVGCGFGAHINMLKDFGSVTALDLNEEALEKIKNKWQSGNVKAIKWKSPEPLSEQFDLMLLSDVLEHIPDDKEAVEWMWQHLKPGGQVLITVPAYQALWTDMDDVCHHYRRYSKKELKNLFVDKFQIKYFSFYNTTLFPVKLLFVALTRGLRKIFPNRPKKSYSDVPSVFINSIFKSILYLEAEIMRKVKLPYGCSLVILAEKPYASN